MFQKIISSLAVTLILGTSLVACTSDNETIEEGNSTISTGRAFEDGASDSDGQTDEGTIQGLTTVTKPDISKELKRMKDALEAGAYSMDINKDEKDGYLNELYYKTNPIDPEILELVTSLSSNKSYCLRASSREHSDVVVYYDSQIKGIVPEGKSCKAPLGTAWTAESVG